ncbi:response regulator [Undibacterium sp. Ji42W]|uniref:response regulator n=1 Tax=Undibacterium sp. Ji42W TaxID=3413039 RepID=UPI003BF1A2DF
MLTALPATADAPQHQSSGSGLSTHGSRLHILLVDDDAEIAVLLSNYLGKFNISCVAVQDGVAMREALQSHNFDVILLDLMLPDEDGLSLLRQLRRHTSTPVIMLTARGEFADKIQGLESGADDYLIKPIDTRELVARIQSVSRRAHASAKQTQEAKESRSTEIRFDAWVLNLPARQLCSPDKLIIPLSNAEFRLLLAFLERPGQILSRDQLIDFARNKSTEVFDRSIDLLVSRLRQKLGDDPRHPGLLKTIRGEGYLFNASVP